MSKTRSGRKILSLILTLCMVLSLLPAMGITASAATDDSWVGSESFNYGQDYTGTGFTWAASTKTLTLSGVNVSAISDMDAIFIKDNATVVLEGNNSVPAVTDKSGLYCEGTLTIKGSGTLEVTGAEYGNNNGVFSAGDMSIESGYVTAAVSNYGVRSGANITVSGGYVSATATATANDFAAVYAKVNYTQTGGYVKAVGMNKGVYADVSLGTVTVSGGYLEASGTGVEEVYGIHAYTITNSGGVVKATGNKSGISGNCCFTGGVTIAEGTGGGGNAISGTIKCWDAEAGADSGENVYHYVDGSLTEASRVFQTSTGATISDTSVVIAKAITAPEAVDGVITLNGHYIYRLQETKYPVTVTGGSYIESDSGIALGTKADLTVNSTLVCVSGGKGSGLYTSGALNIASTGTVVGISANLAGVFAYSLTSAGNLIGVNTGTSNQAGVIFDGNVTGGYVCGLGVPYGIGNFQSAIHVSGGYVTAYATKGDSGVGLFVPTFPFTVSGSATITAIGRSMAYNGAKIAGAIVTGAIVTGAVAHDPALKATEYGNAAVDKTYNVGVDKAKVVCIKRALPTVGEVPTPIEDNPNATAPAIFANGNEIKIVAGTTSNTNILYDINGDGDIGEAEYLTIGDVAPNADGYNLSTYKVVGGCKDEAYIGDTKITMTGGHVLGIIGGNYVTGDAACNLTGDATITISGEPVIDSLVGGCARSTLETPESVVNGNISVSLFGGQVGIVCAGSDNFTNKGSLSISGGIHGRYIFTDSLKDGKFTVSGALTHTGNVFLLAKRMGNDSVIKLFTKDDLGATVATLSDDVTIDLAQFLVDVSGLAIAVDDTSLKVALSPTRTTSLDLTSESDVSYKDTDGKDADFTPSTVTETITSSEGWTFIPDADSETEGKQPQLTLNGFRLAVANAAFALKIPALTTVVVNGENAIITSSGAGICAVGDATFTAADAGTLNVTGQTNGISASGSLTFNGKGTITAIATTGEGVYAWGIIDIYGSKITATGANIGILAIVTISISGGMLTANGADAAMAAVGITIGSGMGITTPSRGVVKEILDSYQTVCAGETPALSVTIQPMPSSDSSGGGSSTPKVPVIVDGQEYNIGTAKTESGVTTVTVDQTALQKQLENASETVVVPVTPGRNADTVVAKFVVANVDEMAEKEMTLSVQVDNVSYDMPAVAVDTKTLMTELGASDPARVPVNVTIMELDGDDVDLTEGELVMPPVSFTVTASFGGKGVEVKQFEKYVQRVIEVPDGVDAGDITTAVVVENGKQRHVPTEVFQKDGKWYARINSLTNSVYALIHNEASFTDSDGKWFETVVTEMASRGIIDGRGEGVFDGEANITRAEFASILVRALGLPENGDASVFTDVPSTAWYYGTVGKAYEYGLVGGRGEGIFDPNAKITRQEAMAMIYSASEIAPIELLSGINPGQYADVDTVSDWAKDAASFNLLNGLVRGDNNLIRPLDNITRGETATIILRLLQKSGLVDVRTEA